MRRTAIVVGSHFVERSKTTNDHLKPKRNMSERNKAAGEFARQINHSQNQAQYRSNSLKKQIVFIILLSLMLSGCAMAPPTQTGPIMIPGSMFSLKDGTEFVFAIEYRFNNGIMTARNLTTGEDFYGNYTAIGAGGGVSKGTYHNVWGGVCRFSHHNHDCRQSNREGHSAWKQRNCHQHHDGHETHLQ